MEAFQLRQLGTFPASEKLLALSWKQPYAELMLHGKIETRTWPTNYRGWVLICASQKEYNYNVVHGISGERQFNRLNQLLNPYPGEYITKRNGMAIAIAKLVDCRPMTKEDEDLCFVKYYPDLFCHVYEDVFEIHPIPWKGKQGWTTVTEETKKLIVVK